MNLHHNSEAFRELVELSADCFGYAQSHVEKDYWVCKILKELALSEYSGRIFFKGGTSLAKAYGLIFRFSEDLDMFIYSGNPQSSKQAEKTLNRNISHFVIENNKEMYREELSKTGGDFRKLAFFYDTHYESAGLKENLEVEIKCCTLEDKSGMYYPAEKRLIEPIVTEYLKEIETQDLINRFEIQAFEVQVVHPKRTLCDKISRLTRLSYNNDFEMQIAKHIRDVYDIYSLLTVPEYSDFIGMDEFMEALKHVTDEDGLYRNSQSHNSISQAVVFARTEQTLKLPAIARAYNTELKKLMFDIDKLPKLEVVIETFGKLREPLEKFDNYRRHS
jgi:predicted nucleotidyltransferase component of viral defense system